MPSQTVVNALNAVLADAIVFYQKLHQYHWVVRGRQFFALHGKFEELYDKWAELTDDTAERVLTVGGKPVANAGDVKAALSAASDGGKQSVLIRVKSANGTRFVAIPLKG